jgi:transposase
VRVGMEATGYSRWLERLLAELGIEVWIGNAAEIKTKRVRKQKTDRQDALLLLKLLLENSFPRVWVGLARTGGYFCLSTHSRVRLSRTSRGSAPPPRISS